MADGTRPTLTTVAERAQVSRQTVSNVLNTPEIVRPETRERVLRVVAELRYRPNVAARQLRTRRSSVLGLRMPPAADGISGQILDRFLHALTAEAQRGGLRIMLFTAPDDEAEIREYQELRATTGIDGFVLADTHPDDPRTEWLAEHEVPFVSFGRPWDGRAAGHPWVDVDGRAGTRDATRHLLELGHRRIAFLGWPEGSGVGDDRCAGWRDALCEAGITDGPLVERAEDGVDEGAAAAARALARDDVTALVCASDSLALGATTVVRALAAREPGRVVAVCGFDDTPVARAVGITSVAQPVDDAAAHAVALVRAQLDSDPLPGGGQVLIAPRLVVRATSPAPR